MAGEPEIIEEEAIGEEIPAEEASEEIEASESEEDPPEKKPEEIIAELQEENKGLKRDSDSIAGAARREEKGKRIAAEAELAGYKRREEAGARPQLPDPEDFKDDLGVIDSSKHAAATQKYEDALYEWRQARETPAAAPADGPSEEATAAAQTFYTRAAEMREANKDFDEVISRPVFSDELRDEMFGSDKGPEIAYFLGKNEAEALRIAQLPPAEMAREVGKLEGRFSAAPDKKNVSKAPDPHSSLEGSGDTPTKDPEKMTDSEWFDWDEKRQEAEDQKSRAG